MVTSASPLGVLFAGQSPALVAGILVAAVGAAMVVVWTLMSLVVDPHPETPVQRDEPRPLTRDEATDPAYTDTFNLTKGDGTG